jgi:hypothetical protein
MIGLKIFTFRTHSVNISLYRQPATGDPEPVPMLSHIALTLLTSAFPRRHETGDRRLPYHHNVQSTR